MQLSFFSGDALGWNDTEIGQSRALIENASDAPIEQFFSSSIFFSIGEIRCLSLLRGAQLSCTGIVTSVGLHKPRVTGSHYSQRYLHSFMEKYDFKKHSVSLGYLTQFPPWFSYVLLA